MIEYFHKYPHELEHIEAFKKFVAQNPTVEFFQPQPLKAPWHVQAIVEGTFINFWPHRLKVQVDGQRAKKGLKAMRQAVAEAMEDKRFDVID